MSDSIFIVEWKDGCFSFFNNLLAVKQCNKEKIKKVYDVPETFTVHQIIMEIILNRVDYPEFKEVSI